MTLESAALNMPANLENPAVATGLEKVSFHSSPKKGNAKEWSNYHKIALISHASKAMLKILQSRLQLYMNWKIPDVQAEFRKARGTRDQIANIHCIIEKAREFQKKYLLLPYWLCQSLWLFRSQQTVGNSSREFTTLPSSWEMCMQVKKQQLEPDIEQTDSKLGKEYVNVLIFILLI